MILITGVAGFIGFHLAKYLLEQGESVIGVDFLEELIYNNDIKLNRLKELGITDIELGRAITSKKYNNFDFSYVEINDKKRLNELFQEFGIRNVIHLAGLTGIKLSEIYPKKFIDVNIQGFNNILELSKEYAVNKFIYASASSIYGVTADRSRELLKETDNTNLPMSMCAVTKKANELMAHTYSHIYNLKTIGLRLFSVYGPYCIPDSAIQIFTNNIINNKPITIHNQGKMTRDFTYIDDVIKSIYLILKNNQIGLCKIYNIGNSEPIKIMDFIAEVEKRLNKESKKNFVGNIITNIRYTGADTTLLQADIGFKPSTSYKIGVKKFIDWYLKYNLRDL